MGYWITPPDLYERLDAEFGFDFDPCPFPRNGFDGLVVPWGESSYVNPPFNRTDADPKRGPTAFVRKAIAEHQLGRRSVTLLPCPSWVNLMLTAGAELRDMGRVAWLDTETGEPWPSPRPTTAFILR